MAATLFLSWTASSSTVPGLQFPAATLAPGNAHHATKALPVRRVYPPKRHRYAQSGVPAVVAAGMASFAALVGREAIRARSCRGLKSKRCTAERHRGNPRCVATSCEAKAISVPSCDSFTRKALTFPNADLPWPFEHIRVTGPGESKQREACGDWITLFRSAAPYIAAFRGGIVVLHLPSFLLEEHWQENFKGLMEDVAFCSLLGLRIVIVTSIESKVLRRVRLRLGVDQPSDSDELPPFVVDKEALRIIKQEAGFARVEVESALTAGFEKRSSSSDEAALTSAGIFSLRSAVSVVSSMNFFTAAPVGVRKGVDYMFAGVVRSVNVDLLERRLGDGDIVSLTPLGASPSGQAFFVDSEALAVSIATKLQAMKLVFITQGQRLVDMRDGRVLAGMQVHNAQEFLDHLEGTGSEWYTPEVKSLVWFSDFLQHLRLLASAVSPQGVLRGHFVDPTPGALLQEFYTTDGSGTAVAQDAYQGLGGCAMADAVRIHKLLELDATERGLRSSCTVDEIESCCSRGEFFVWKRDETVLGCGRLVLLYHEPTDEDDELSKSIAELTMFAVAESKFSIYADALLAYAQRVALQGGASFMVVLVDNDPNRTLWLTARGFREPSPAELEGLPPQYRESLGILLQPLDAGIAKAAEAASARFAEEQRMWGDLS